MAAITLWLMRHGDASFHAQTDAERPLSERGRNEVISIANLLKGRNFNLDFVWVSPYLRAQQTWALVKTALLGSCDHGSQSGSSQCQAQPTLEINLDAPITPGDDPKKVIGALADQTVGNGFLVAHQPLLGRLATCFETGEIREQSLGTASILVLEMGCIAPGCASIKEHLYPR